jgi:diguanylate cyclase (GGDEF)-like protein/PAS domain S-box-containing protein
MESSGAKDAALLDLLGDGLVIWTAEGTLVARNRRAAVLLDIPDDRLDSLSFGEVVRHLADGYSPVATDGTPATMPTDVATVLEHPAGRFVLGLTHPGEARRWLEVDLAPTPGDHGDPRLLAAFRDVTEQRTARDNARFRERMLGAIGQPVTMVDPRRNIIYWNDAATRLFGWTADEVIGRRVLDVIHIEGGDAALDRDRDRLLADEAVEHDFRVRHRDGQMLDIVATRTPVLDEHGELLGVIAVFADMTSRKRAEDALAHQALHDDLTGLPNRLLLVDRLGRSLVRAERGDSHVAVLFLDLDRFKVVNDSLGHAVGDAVLVEVAARLSRVIRLSDTVSRFGGDEFVLVCEEVDGIEEAQELAQRALRSLAEPIRVSGRDLYATASIGIAMGGSSSSVDQLLRDADAAMYRAKDLGRARTEVFSHDLRVRVASRLDLETALRRAVDQEELRLLFQPIVRLSDGQVVGAEALLRWERAGLGTVLPDDFIPIAEETGLIVPIGEWALRSALETLEQLTDGRRLDPALPLLAVNLSALQLRLPASIDMVRDALDATRVAPGMLSLEIAESALMHDIDRSAQALDALRDLGVHLAIDDFGTGYSSLTHLKRLPIDALKVDRTFVDGLPGEPRDRFITEAIVTLGRSLHLTLVAEGVETVAQWDALDAMGCELGQGYLWSRPVDAEAFAALHHSDFAALRSPPE